jgi:hypothetical protein
MPAASASISDINSTLESYRSLTTARYIFLPMKMCMASAGVPDSIIAAALNVGLSTRPASVHAGRRGFLQRLFVKARRSAPGYARSLPLSDRGLEATQP